MVLRFIDTSRSKGVEHAAFLLKDAWRLSWTRTIIEDNDPTLYTTALESLLKMLQNDHNVALLRPDPEFRCLRRFQFRHHRHENNSNNNTSSFEPEIQHIRQFLLAVTRRIFDKLGHSNPYVLCFDNLDDRLQQAARNAQSPVDVYVPTFPPLLRRFALDRRYGTHYLLEGDAEVIGRSFNEWRMEHGLDPLYRPLLQPSVAQWREQIAQLVANVTATQVPPPVPPPLPHVPPPPVPPPPHAPPVPPPQRSQQPRPSPRMSVVSLEEELPAGMVEEHNKNNNEPPSRRPSLQQQNKLDVVVPSICLTYAKECQVDLLAVVGGDNDTIVDQLTDAMVQWRQQPDDDRSYIRSNVVQWKKNIELVLAYHQQQQQGSSDNNNNDTLFLQALSPDLQQFLAATTQERDTNTTSHFMALPVAHLKQQYRTWRSSRQPQDKEPDSMMRLQWDMEITDGRSRISRLQAAALGLRGGPPLSGGTAK